MTTFPLCFGLTGEPILNISAGATPVGFDVDRYGHLRVSEAAGAAVVHNGMLSEHTNVHDLPGGLNGLAVF